MISWVRRLAWGVMVLMGVLALLGTARAHELSMAEMDLRETAPGEFVWMWTANGSRPAASELTPQWPQGCKADGNLLRCGAAGLQGVLGMQGVGQGYSAALIKLTWLDGQRYVYTLTAGQPTVRLLGAADDPRGMADVFKAYVLLGIEHILSGVDHLLFVACLLFLVGFNKRLVLTITAFTVAHSLTLGLSAMGWLVLRPPPVEATIALSIMLVASEALHQRQTLSRRWPAMVAFLFGLVHGLGFAGALKDIGLPDNHMLMALLSFNLGVEAGQLFAVLVVWLLAFAWSSLSVQAQSRALAPALAQARTVALYGIGGLAAFWTLSRVAVVLG